MPDSAPYRGLFGAVRYAFSASDSLVCRSYVLVGGALAAFVGILFVLGFVVAVFQTLGAGGGTVAFARAFVAVVGLLVLLPLLAPILLVARRHRTAESDAGYDRALALAGYAYVGSLYLALLISAPAELQRPVHPLVAPVVGALYVLPPVAGLLPPLAAAVLIAIAHRVRR